MGNDLYSILETDGFVRLMVLLVVMIVTLIVLFSKTHQIQKKLDDIDTNYYYWCKIKDLYTEVVKINEKNASSLNSSLTVLTKSIDKYFKVLTESTEKHWATNTSAEEHRYQTILSTLNNFQILEISIKHQEDINSSICKEILNTLFKETEGIKESLSQYQERITQIDELYKNLENLCSNEDVRNSNIESLLSSIVDKHKQICDATIKMNKTSTDIFEFMKLYLVHTTLDNFKKL